MKKNMPTTHISLVAIFNANTEVLLLKRKQDVHCPDVWSFPGGKVEIGETALAAAQRELKEESGLVGLMWQLIGEHSHVYNDKEFQFSLFFCQHDNKAELAPESEHVWCNLENLEALVMPEANREMVQMLLQFSQTKAA